MRTSASKQAELDFEAPTTAGFDLWKTDRQNALHELARRMGLPLQVPVEVWLKGEVRLRGVLRLQDQVLIPEAFNKGKIVLEVDGVPFIAADIISCVRM